MKGVPLLAKRKVIVLLLCLAGAGLWLLDRSEVAKGGAGQATHEVVVSIPEIDRLRPETETALFALG